MREEEERRKKELLEELAKPPCQQKGGSHLWRDFPAFIQWKTGKNGYIKVMEPYICTYCHERDDRLLEKTEYSNLSQQRLDEIIDKLMAEYPDLIKPRVVVEDMVEDAIHVDRMRLKIWEQLHTPEKPIPETEEERLKRYGEEMLR